MAKNYLRNRLHIVGDFPNGKYNLQIQHLEARDHGLYICELRRMSDSFHLKVVGMCCQNTLQSHNPSVRTNLR
jgi:hypothetical protein